MAASPIPQVEALRHSHELLRAAVEPLDASQLEQGSYDTEWSIAQVVSHLGSQAEIFGLFMDAGLEGKEPPGQDMFPPVWDRWNAKSPREQAADGLRAGQATLERFENLDEDQRARLHMNVFGRDIDAAGLAAMALGEHAVHTWDIRVVLDPAATVSPDAVALLLDGLGELAGWSGKPDGQQRKIRVTTTDPEHTFILETTTDEVTLTTADGEGTPELGLSELALPAESFLRLVYGRLDADQDLQAGGAGVELGELRPIFPGF